MSGPSWRRLLAAAAAAVAVALAAAPYWNLERHRRRIQASLERELHRRVTAGKARLGLLGGPSVSLSDVIIEDDPRVGREPFAYVTSLEARLALRSLWTGKLEFASLRLVEPSVNLVKPATGSWNFVDLVSRPPEIPGSGAGRLPAISVRKGRINFKFGDTKSVLYLANADVDLQPPSRGQPAWEVRFSGEPARADRPAHGLGRIAGRGRVLAGKELELDVTVERTYLEEISTLLAGRDLGLRGQLTSRARVQGPASALRITGAAQVRDFRRWDLLPSLGGDWRLNYEGAADLPGQRLKLEAAPATGLPLKFRWEAVHYLSEPEWKAEVALEAMPADALLELLRVVGVPAPTGLALSGAVSGVLAYRPGPGWEGALEARDVTAQVASGLQLRCLRLPISIEADRLRLGPGKIETPDEGRLTLEGSWSRQDSAFSLILKGERVPTAVPGPGLWPDLPDVPLLAACSRGAWTGTLRFVRDPPKAGRWTGRVDLHHAEISVPGLASPLKIEQAEFRLAADEIRLQSLQGTAGDIPFIADYAAQEAEGRPARLDVRIERLDLADLERLLAPVLDRRGGMLARALRRRRAPAPGWLLRRRLEGRIEAAAVDLDGVPLAAAARGRLSWDGLKAAIRELHARAGQGELRGRIEVDLRRATPVYAVTLAGGPLEAGGGRWWIEGRLETEGVGEELTANLRAQGSVLGRGIPIAADDHLELLAARFTVRQLRRVPRLSVEALEAVHRDAIFQGAVRAEPNGKVVAELTSEHRRLRLEGTLWPFKLARASSP